METFWRWSVEGGSHTIAGYAFVRVHALVLAIAFASLAPQLRGLVGSRGILPVEDRFPPLRGRERLRAAREIPSICWWLRSDRGLVGTAWAGAIASVLAGIGIAPIPMLVVAYAAYLSLWHACDEFLSYQWDALLVEGTIVAILLSPIELTAFAPTPVATPALWLGWLLLFRLMFGSGFVKLASGDHTWRSLTALSFHYETQPLPTRLAWYAEHLPMPIHRAATAVSVGVELLVPFLVLGPRGVQAIACAIFVALMIVIQATGNYAFFNLEAIALSLLLIDDGYAHALLPLATHDARVLPDLAASIVVAPFVMLAASALAKQLSPGRRLPRPIAIGLSIAARYGLVGVYGLFSMMTTERPEIVIEGSDDGHTWTELEPRWKPGDPRRAPRVVAPHQPRLDWQLWFAALSPGVPPWLLAFLVRVLQGSPDVLRLLAPGAHAPKLVRARLYRYRMSDAATRRATGAWWTRELIGDVVPAIGLRASRA